MYLKRILLFHRHEKKTSSQWWKIIKIIRMGLWGANPHPPICFNLFFNVIKMCKKINVWEKNISVSLFSTNHFLSKIKFIYSNHHAIIIIIYLYKLMTIDCREIHQTNKSNVQWSNDPETRCIKEILSLLNVFFSRILYRN